METRCAGELGHALDESETHNGKGSGDMRSGCSGWNSAADREQLSIALDGGQC